jgi:hypothetical protein
LQKGNAVRLRFSLPLPSLVGGFAEVRKSSIKKNEGEVSMKVLKWFAVLFVLILFAHTASAEVRKKNQ